MISSVFGKTKPINYVLVLAYLFLLYVLVRWFGFDNPPVFSQWPFVILTLGSLLLSALLVNFIVQRNQLTGSHGYAMFIYALLFLYFPRVLTDGDAIGANLFFLLGMRRLISLHSLRNVKSKLFDATLWFLVASLFVKWSVLLLLLVYLYLYFYEPKVLRNWLVPPAALVAFLMIAAAVAALTGQSAELMEYYSQDWFRFQTLGISLENGLTYAVYLVLVVAAVVISFVRLSKTGHGRIVSMRLLFMVFAVTSTLNFIGSRASSGVEILSFFPAAIFFSRYVETVRREPLRDALLWGVLLLGALLWLASLILK